MIYQTVDLYEYFGKKNMGKGGRLIVYSPDNSDEINADRVRPAILIAPGGGYRNVSFREGEPVALQFLARGFVVFVLSYDVYPFAYPYSPLVEGGMAMKYIRAEGSRYGADTGKVCAAGFSAGGHLVSFLATAFDDEIFREFFGERCADGIRPDAVILAYPVISHSLPTKSLTLSRLCGNDCVNPEKFSTELRVTENSSPAFIWATFDDESVNPLNALKMAEAYCEKGVRCSVVIYPHGQHGLSVADDSVYRTDKPYKTSENVRLWIDDACSFMKLSGIAIKD